MEKLKLMPYAQAHIVRLDDGTIILYSYATAVARIEDNCLIVEGLYSATTRRHIGAFAKQFGTDYSTAKRCFVNLEAYNLKTKEFIPYLL